MPRGKTNPDQVVQLTIRVTHEMFEDINAVHEFIRSIGDKWFSADHLNEAADVKPHTHYYVQTNKTAQNVRVQLAKKVNSKGSTGANKAYAVSELREELHHYYSYVMLKPESENLQHSGEKIRIPWTKDHGAEPEYRLGAQWKNSFPDDPDMEWCTFVDFEETIKLACTYAKQVKKVDDTKKAVNWMEEVLRDCYWDPTALDKDNFRTLFAYLVRRKYVNQFTEAKVRNIWYMWKCHNQIDTQPEEFNKVLDMFWTRM